MVALDGNGMPIQYSGNLRSVSDTSSQACIKIGRSIGNIQIEIFDENDQVIDAFDIDLEETSGLDVVESTTPMVLCIESENIISTSLTSVEAQLFGTECEILSLQSVDELPIDKLAYEGVRAIYLSMADAELIKSISQAHWSAVQEWVAGGGKIIISLGPGSTELLDGNKVLSELVPGKVTGTFEINNSIQFERFARSKPPQLLKRGDDPILASTLNEPEGIVELAIGKKPLVVRMVHGFGQVVCSTVDFDKQPLTQWNGHKKFLMRLTNGQLNLNRTTTGASDSRNIVTYGYRDILGQLVFPLEKFSRVSFINFTIVAVLIALFLLCIGPGDYFLLKHTVKKMEWTWLTFSLFAAAFCFLAIYISRTTKPTQMQINQLEIIDIDQASNRVRGNIWTNIYSPANSKNSLTAPDQNSLGVNTGNATLSWMGIPGSGLAGMNSKTAARVQLQHYDCQFEGDSTGSRIENLPIKVSSTKPLFTQYSDSKDFGITSRLSQRRNRLQGTFKNPFDLQLENCRIVYDNWTYVMSKPLGPGDTVDVSSELTEKTASSYFSRRVNTESDKGGSQPWRPEEDDMDRIAEMMMFFELGGGQQYTRLTHEYRPQLDLSELLGLNRAIFYGRISDASTQLKIESNAGDSVYDQSRTYVRIVLPVQNKPSTSQR